MRTIPRAQKLRSLNVPALLVLLAGCQADPAPLAQRGTTAKRPSVIQLAGAEEAVAPSQVAQSDAASLDREALSDATENESQPERPAHGDRAAVLLEPPTAPPSPEPPAPSTEPEDALVDVEGSPADVGAYLEVARRAHQRGLAGLAEKYYFKAVDAYPNSALAWNDLGQFYKAQQKYAQGVHATQMAVRLEPESQRYHNNLGELLVLNGRVDEGIREFAVAVGRAAAHYNAGVVLYELGKHTECVRQMQLALAEDAQLRQAQAALKHLAPGAAGTQRGVGASSGADANEKVQRRAEGPVLKQAERSGSSRHLKRTSGNEGKSLTQRIGEFLRRPGTALRTSNRDSAARYRSQEQPRRGLFSTSRADRSTEPLRTAPGRESDVQGGKTE